MRDRRESGVDCCDRNHRFISTIVPRNCTRDSGRRGIASSSSSTARMLSAWHCGRVLAHRGTAVRATRGARWAASSVHSSAACRRAAPQAGRRAQACGCRCVNTLWLTARARLLGRLNPDPPESALVGDARLLPTTCLHGGVTRSQPACTARAQRGAGRQRAQLVVLVLLVGDARGPAPVTDSKCPVRPCLMAASSAPIQKSRRGWSGASCGA